MLSSVHVLNKLGLKLYQEYTLSSYITISIHLYPRSLGRALPDNKNRVIKSFYFKIGPHTTTY